MGKERLVTIDKIPRHQGIQNCHNVMRKKCDCTTVLRGMKENPERSGTERNGTEPEVVIVSSCTTNFAQYFGS